MRKRTIKLYYLQFLRWLSCKKVTKDELLIYTINDVDYLIDNYSQEDITKIIDIKISEIKKRKKESIVLQEQTLEKSKKDYEIFLKTINEF